MSEGAVDSDRRRFLTGTASVIGGVGAGLASIPFIATFQPSARAKAIGAPVEVDISQIEPGQRIIHKWRGKPVWIVRRTDFAVRQRPKAGRATQMGTNSDQNQKFRFRRTPFVCSKLRLLGFCRLRVTEHTAQ